MTLWFVLGLMTLVAAFAVLWPLSHVPSREAADQVFAEALAAGAKPVKAPQEVFWGGYSGYFADPDGHLWEVAHNPAWPLGDDERPILP